MGIDKFLEEELGIKSSIPNTADIVRRYRQGDISQEDVIKEVYKLQDKTVEFTDESSEQIDEDVLSLRAIELEVENKK